MFDKAEYYTDAKTVYFINLACKNNIKIYGVAKKDDGCVFSVNAKDTEKVEKLLASCCKKCEKRRDRTFRCFVRRNASRFGIYVGIFIVALLLFFWSNEITEIRVSGNELVSGDSITEIVTGGNKLPLEKKKIDLNEIEKELIAADGISNVSLEIKGSVLIVNVLEELEKPNVVDYNDKNDLISGYDAVITSVTAYSGTPVVNVGDTVKKGATLISHEKILEDGTVLETKALGDVYGRIWITADYVFTPTVLKGTRTGRRREYYVAASSKVVPESPFENSECVTEGISDSFVFPLKLKKITYYEVEFKEEEFDFQANAEKLIAEKTVETEKLLPEDCRIVRNWYSQKTVDKNTILVIYYEIIVKLTG
jgi:sporulation protein YqfD